MPRAAMQRCDKRAAAVQEREASLKCLMVEPRLCRPLALCSLPSSSPPSSSPWV